MFYLNRNVIENPVVKNDSLKDSVFESKYLKHSTYDGNKISISLQAEEKATPPPLASLKHKDELNAISVIMNRTIQKSLTLKSPSVAVENHELPFPVITTTITTATTTTTPKLSSPIEQDQESLSEPSLYEGDHQSISVSDSVISSSVVPSIAHLTQLDNKEITEETWGAIFHPQSTFKHHGEGLEYVAWNSSNLPVAAAHVAQRILRIAPYVEDPVQATLPKLIQPKPSPVLTIAKEEEEEPKERRRYFDMLKKIRGEEEEEEEENKEIYQNATTLFKKYFGPTIKTEPIRQYVMMEEGATPVTAQAMIHDPETVYDTTVFWTEKNLFWLGFLCPLVWFYAAYRNANVDYSVDVRWQRRCRDASLYFSAVVSVAILVTAVKAAGSAGARQAQSDTIRAVIVD
ncbi:hypothetical protein BD770DRAFT_464433 [Pilaira anomala]|nr:hypothetical protein BD770DRAFT_464433 [Pilaira anomala]